MKILKAVRGFLKKYPHAWLSLYFVFYLLMFFTVEKVVDGSGEYWVSYMPLDDRIPFVEAFVVPYCLWYPFLALVGIVLLLHDGDGFKKYIYFVAIGFTVSLVFCLLVPNGQDLRPSRFERSNIFTKLIGLLYAADTNTNVFPSMHVIGCAAGVCAAFHSESMRRMRWPLLILSLFITASTVFIKQHSFLDIIGALVLCVPIYMLVYLLPERKEKKREKTSA